MGERVGIVTLGEWVDILGALALSGFAPLLELSLGGGTFFVFKDRS